MIDHRQKLQQARKLFIDRLSIHIVADLLHPIRPVLKVEFRGNFVVYLRYNQVGEYSYHIQFSSKENDRIRFDNMDDLWPVDTKPHHFHQLLH